MQTIVITLAAFMAVTAAVLAGSLLVVSNAPFAHSFTQQHGAHLSVLIDGTQASAGQVSATAHATGVTESAGPFPVITQTVRIGAAPGSPGLVMDLPMTIVGRGQPTGGVDRVSLTKGRWAGGPGEIVVGADVPLGETVVFAELPNQPSFTVVGVARSISRTADAWVTPSTLATLTPPGSQPNYQMLYRFTTHTTTAEMDTNRTAIEAILPSNALLGSQSWLTLKKDSNRDTALFVPFLVAFGLIGLVMAVLSVGGVIAGAVGSATHRIGVLKALGFTPAQVVRAYLGQALIPASVGIALGVFAGNLLTVPVLASASDVYQSAPSGIVSWVDAVVVIAAVVVVAVTAWLASWRAGRLRTVDALALGRTPVAERGRRMASLAARLPLPRTVTLGLAQPFARPARLAVMTGTVVFGTAAVVLAVGLTISLNRVEATRGHDSAPVAVRPAHPEPRPLGPGSAGGDPGGPGPVPAPDPGGIGPGGSGSARSGPGPIMADPAAVRAAITAQNGTKDFYGIAPIPASVAGLSGTIDAIGLRGNASWAGWLMTTGRWFHAPGEAIAPTGLLDAAGVSVGDTITIIIDNHPITLRIVGEVFSTENDGMQIFTDLDSLLVAAPRLQPEEYRISVDDGVDLNHYVAGLNTALRPLGLEAQHNSSGHSEILAALNALTATLTLMLIVLAALGVLNAVVLQTRERVRDLGVHKALGMTPRQAVGVVLSSVVLIGLIGGVLGVPAGMALHGVLVPAMGEGAGLRLPRLIMDVYQPWLIVALALGGLIIAILGALLPAGWAARVRTATALRTE